MLPLFCSAKLLSIVVKHVVSHEMHCSQILLTNGRECLVIASANFTFNVKSLNLIGPLEARS